MGVASLSQSQVKSVQRGVVTCGSAAGVSTTVTISAVNTAKAVVLPGSMGNSYNGGAWITMVLTDSTTLTITPGATAAPQVAWEVIEYV